MQAVSWGPVLRIRALIIRIGFIGNYLGPYIQGPCVGFDGFLESEPLQACAAFGGCEFRVPGSRKPSTEVVEECFFFGGGGGCSMVDIWAVVWYE